MIVKEEKKLSRRDMLKVGGVMALGLAYTKPMVQTVSAKNAFDVYIPGAGGGISSLGFDATYWQTAVTSWPAAFSPQNSFDDVFQLGQAAPGLTLGQALASAAFPATATAAILNAASLADYPLSQREVISYVQHAYETGQFEAVALWFNSFHNNGIAA